MSGWQNRKAVYALDLTGTQQLVLLGLVEHADDEGRDAFPSTERSTPARSVPPLA